MKNIVFIPNIDCGDSRSKPFKYSILSWKKWAEQYDDIEVIEWTQPITDPSVMKITLQRYWVFDILKHNNIKYNQVLIVDADTIVHPNCPNFFSLTENKLCGVINNGSYEWTIRSIREWGNVLFPEVPKVAPWKYINGGFIIANDQYIDFFNTIKEFYTSNLENIKYLTSIIKAGTDQTIVNYLIQINNIDIKYLPECFNLQDMFAKDLLFTPGRSWWKDELLFLDAGWIYHFNSIPNMERNIYYWMERTFNELYQ